MNALYAAGALLIVAQLVGIYGLKTRKADLVFAILMAALVVAALFVGIHAALSHLHT